jgi:hypothetical protein
VHQVGFYYKDMEVLGVSFGLGRCENKLLKHKSIVNQESLETASLSSQ